MTQKSLIIKNNMFFTSNNFLFQMVHFLVEAEKQPAGIEDFALADLPDEQETIKFDGGEICSFFKQQWLEL